MIAASDMSPSNVAANLRFDTQVVATGYPANGRTAAQLYRREVKSEEMPKVEFEGPRQAIYDKVPDDFIEFYRQVDKAFDGQWAPRNAFEEIFNWYLDKAPKRKVAIAKLAQENSEEWMTNYMLDAIERGGMGFIESLGREWSPLVELLKHLPLNQRRSFCCKILYQRMQELRLGELQRSVKKPKEFQRATSALTKEQLIDEFWQEHLPENVRDVYLTPRKLTAPYGIKVAQLQIRGHYMPPVEFYADFCARAAYYFGLPCSGPVPLPVNTRRWSVIKAPFAMKKNFETFERKTFSRLLTIKDGHPDVVEMWISYCHRNTYAGTALKVHLFTNDYIGVGRTMSEDIKQIIETDRWGIDGYNDLSDDATRLKNTVDRELARLEAQVAEREESERARRVLQYRVNKLLELEDAAYGAAAQEFEAKHSDPQLSAPKAEGTSVHDPNALPIGPEEHKESGTPDDNEPLDVDDLAGLVTFSTSLEESPESESDSEDIAFEDGKFEEEDKNVERADGDLDGGERPDLERGRVEPDEDRSLKDTDVKDEDITTKAKADESPYSPEDERQIAQLASQKLEPILSRLIDFRADDLEREVEWDKSQDDALRRHILHIGLYAQEKGIGPLTREEYFTYVPFVLLPKYKGIHKDVLEEVDERGLLRVPMGNAGYLRKWDEMSETERYEAVLEHRAEAEEYSARREPFEGDIRSVTKLEKVLLRKMDVRREEVPEALTVTGLLRCESIQDQARRDDESHGKSGASPEKDMRKEDISSKEEDASRPVDKESSPASDKNM